MLIIFNRKITFLITAIVISSCTLQDKFKTSIYFLLSINYSYKYLYTLIDKTGNFPIDTLGSLKFKVEKTEILDKKLSYICSINNMNGKTIGI